MTNLDDFFFYPRVYNIKTDEIPENSVNVMRPSKWGNPFRLSDHNNDRDKVIDLYTQYIYNRCEDPNFLQELKNELKGKHLLCCCHPKKCHADILLIIANQ